MGPDQIIEKLHVETEFRQRGFASILVSYLTQDILERDIVPSVIIERNNYLSRSLFEKLNYHLILTEDLKWLRVGYRNT